MQSKKGEDLMAVLPSGHRLSLAELYKITNKRYQLVGEEKLQELFSDCKQGAIPSIGHAYKIKMIIDNILLNGKCVYIEAGEHSHLIKTAQNQYTQLMSALPHANICGSAIGSPKFTESLSSKWSQN